MSGQTHTDTSSAAQLLGHLQRAQVGQNGAALGKNAGYQQIYAFNTAASEQVITPSGLAYGIIPAVQSNSRSEISDYCQQMAVQYSLPAVYVSGDDDIPASVTFPSGEQFTFTTQAAKENAAAGIVKKFEEHLLGVRFDKNGPAADRGVSLDGGSAGRDMTPNFIRSR